ncbi:MULTISPECIES: NO-inducible flavohemoprotein [unclassified Pseudomonas]|uniref:NO-inducible flavohemoprotein n=1 Tax=unclassified Pseudomonas TaxID=196821 RepID=UPI002AC97415|nr:MULTISPECIES: NO-inducible flavohemoprotein [unclassified Pseudomonas]MEB0040444.1 NO-inducible flavohemoprotein [Pseudomonas sp. MH10]MEB0078807.1 NO-inducible flavohemoprotein [Pseudomonas sp. MH10out]MEB0089712.1 NO-inducible flavohemoprotein [Pseudomonas sp. CCI4.2]MEB0103579.1 NO-inducible flavohemoprotein [Pseudomonas sp. CCI3.2]MEB0121302.1 NO-inducible flavohemoprotein [Pseudomonas sp. CCI1.2]
MLNAHDRAIVKSTVPLLESGGETLTTYFYQMMLREYPEVRPLFNQAHQASGDQPRALANGVLMYARHIDELEQLGNLVAKIINKHVALQILPHHYPIVGTCLIRAIEEVLGSDIATPEVLQAWGNAYKQLSDILIGAERVIYEEKAEAVGGWRGAREFEVARRVDESTEITSFYFVPVDGEAVLDYTAGQYIGLQLFINGEETRRNYSLSAIADGIQYRISVKREPHGVASNFLHDHVHVGERINLFTPSGEFTLVDSIKPLVLISGGVGITPTLAMLETALSTSRPVHFIHCARNGGVHAFRDWVNDLASLHPQLKHFYCYAEDDGVSPQAQAVGLLDQQQLEQWLPEDRDLDAYFLGPKGFMASIKRQLKAAGVPEQQSRYEFFGPAAALEL